MDTALLPACDRKPVLAHGRQVPAARDECHVAPCMREASAVKAADAARTHYDNFHNLSPIPIPESTSATCRTWVLVSPRRRKRPSMLSMQPRSPSTIASAPVASALSHLLSASRVEIAPNLTAKVPPKPQHVSASFISLSLSPATFASSARGCVLIPISRSPEHAS